MKTIKIKQLFSQEPLDFGVAQMFRQLGFFPDELKREGVSVSVRVPHKLFASDNEKRAANREAYEQIMNHQELFTFVSAYGYRSLEEFKDSDYGNKYLWIVIGDRMAFGKNRLVVTSGHAPNRLEAYFRASNYDEFWSIVERLTEMMNNPHKEHEPVILTQNNGYCGSSYKEWQIAVI